MYKKRVWTENDNTSDSVSANLLQYQAIHDVVSGLRPFSLEETTILAALHLQIVHGDGGSKKQIITP